MSNEKHNPLSQEGVGIHEKSKEEKAKDRGISVEEFDEKVLTLEAGDKESVDMVRQFVAEIKSHAYHSDDYTYLWPRLDEIANQLLVDGSLDIQEYLEYVDKDVFHKYGYGGDLKISADRQITKGAIRMIQKLLKKRKEKAA